MKIILLLCSGLLMLGVANLPIGFYTLLRIVVTIGSVTVVIKEFENGFSVWIIVFGFIAVLFNPIIPVYLHDKTGWMPIDIICSVVFLIRAFMIRTIESK